MSKIINASYKIISDIDHEYILKLVEKIGRICYNSQDRITDDLSSAESIIRSFINNHHDAMLEHGSMSVWFRADRAFTHELVRHRMASFAQESQRYIPYDAESQSGEVTFIDPTEQISLDKKMKNLDAQTIAQILTIWSNAMDAAEEAYMDLRKLGATPQIARSVLPNSTAANIVITANWREWRHIFKLRAEGVTGVPAPCMREVMVPLLIEVQTKIPVLFDDITIPE